MSNYEFEFTERGPYGAAVRLLGDTDLHDKVVLDLGCGSAAVATPIGRLGAHYVGLDYDADSVAKLADQGFEAHQVDLTAGSLPATLRTIIAGRPVAAVLCLDVLEHVTEPALVLAALAEVTGAHPGVELVVSIPNIAHRDIARRLLVGEWETTDSGLLDRTHLRFFTDTTLTELMAGTGWYESARLDFPLEESDQHRAGHPVFEPATNLGGFLDQVRRGADGFGAVNQFVRRYHRGSPRRVEPAPDGDAPFVSIVLRTQGRRPETLTDVLCCLAAQTCLDFEVVLVVHDSTMATPVRELVDEFETNIAHRVRVVSCDGGTRGRPANVGLREATGEYLVFVDDDDLVTADWVENIRTNARTHRGMIVRWWAAEQQRRHGRGDELADHLATSPLTPTYATRFDLVRHIRQNETPFHCFAFPRTLVELGFAFDETLTVCEDWQFLVRAASVCGVYDTDRMTCVYNKWADNTSAQAASAEEWFAMRSVAHIGLDERPLLLPPGSVRALDRTLETVEKQERWIAQLEADLAQARQTLADTQQVSSNAHHALTELRSSTSWKVSAPVRLMGSAGRKVFGRLRRR
ncbi:methyltransferase domain-containing protein [Actinophytocola sp.]|uniref:methyltransferase domain-containing protein n=1 Tax=Actinophytocola sp. TaxID=1872138 RepID=UPI002ED8DF38